MLATFAGGAWWAGLLDKLPADGEHFDLAQHGPLIAYAFLYYFVNYFVIVYFNAALIGATWIRLLGADPTVADGFRAANRCLPSILGYALIAATVGVILKALRDQNDSFIGRIVGGILGFAWTLLTFLVVPVIVIENAGPISAIKRSGQLLRHTWGEQLVSNVSFGFLGFLLALPGVALIFFGVFAWGSSESLVVAGGCIAVAVAYFVTLAIVMSALEGIFVAALYAYAVDQGIGFFPDSAIAGAFHRR